MNKLIIAIVLLLIGKANAQLKTEFVEDWKTYPIPTDENTLINYNRANYWPVVTLSKNKVLAIPKDSKQDSLPFGIDFQDAERYKFKGEKYVYKVDDGYLVGFNHGEFGASFFWFSDDGKHKQEITGGHQIIQFIFKEGKLYAIEGLAHMSTNYGSIIEISRKNQKWVAEKYLKLSQYPNAITADNGNFFIITPNSLLKVDIDRNIDTLIKNGFWNPYLFPTSIVYKNNNLYVGMANGVFRYNLKTKNEDWLMP